LLPAEPDTGIVFRRKDVPAERSYVEARYDRVSATQLGTTLSNEQGTTLSTVEHLMAALSGLGIDNVVVEVDGPEVPILDGSALGFAQLIDRGGIETAPAARRFIKVIKPVEVIEGNKRAALMPAESFTLSFEIDFRSAAIGHQQAEFAVAPSIFRREIAAARTFGFLEEVEHLRTKGLTLGGSLDNAIVVSGDRVLNEGPLRFKDEFVRHKMLDALGDLALAGAPLIARYEGVRAGHELNNRLLRALFADSSAWRVEKAAPEVRPMAEAPIFAGAGF
jgi:UDP-3-O-[3-hydroxymyristoyl] N-acetylglucosamine deacetylase